MSQAFLVSVPPHKFAFPPCWCYRKLKWHNIRAEFHPNPSTLLVLTGGQTDRYCVNSAYLVPDFSWRSVLVSTCAHEPSIRIWMFCTEYHKLVRAHFLRDRISTKTGSVIRAKTTSTGPTGGSYCSPMGDDGRTPRRQQFESPLLHHSRLLNESVVAPRQSGLFCRRFGETFPPSVSDTGTSRKTRIDIRIRPARELK